MQPVRGARARIKVLLADDEPNLRMLVRSTLEHPDRHILEAADGREALELARREDPDLVVLDHMMPGLTGLDVLRTLRARPDARAIPIVMLTASSQDRERLEAERLGVDAYLVKPFSPLELLRTVERLEGVDLPGEPVHGEGGRADVAAPLPADVADEDALLELPASQLVRYTRDLREAVAAERTRAAELSDAYARLKILDRLKTDFLAFISHELRTPLNHMAAVGIFDPDADRGEQLETIEVIRLGYERLESFVLRGLEYFNWLGAERGDLSRTTDLAALLRRVACEVPELQAPDIACRIDVGSDAPMLVRGRDADLAKVVWALLANAVKFSPCEKIVAVTLRRRSGRVLLTVSDRGSGFAPEMAGELLRPFTVVDGTHHSHGSGLNLAIASAIVGAHGGRIEATSPGDGLGATFTVDLPEAEPAAVAVGAA